MTSFIYFIFKTWKLPVLLVDDFSSITPSLLRLAYLEALYHVDEFEFGRLKQSYWYSLIMKVSAGGSSRPYLDAFPMIAEDSSFTRPKVPFSCGKDGSKCGKNTKYNTPIKSC
jgi:hypothetical protein